MPPWPAGNTQTIEKYVQTNWLWRGSNPRGQRFIAQSLVLPTASRSAYDHMTPRFFLSSTNELQQEINAPFKAMTIKM